MLLRAHGDPICDDSTHNLCDAIEAEPDPDSETLFFHGIPLARDESEAGSDSGLTKAQEESNGDSATKVLGRGEAGEDHAPSNDTSCTILPNRQILQ